MPAVLAALCLPCDKCFFKKQRNTEKKDKKAKSNDVYFLILFTAVCTYYTGLAKHTPVRRLYILLIIIILKPSYHHV